MYFCKEITIVAGTPAQVVAAGPGTLARRCWFQMATSAAGQLGYVLFVPLGVNADKTKAEQVVQELPPSSTTAPGLAWFDKDFEMGIDMTRFYLDGAHSGDLVRVCWVPRIG